MGTSLRTVATALALSACGLSALGELEPGPGPSPMIPDASSPGTDASSSDSGAVPDASDGGDASPAGKQCVTFANTIAPFVYEGDDGGYALDAGSVTLTLASGKAARLAHVFTAPKIYAHTLVDVHLGASFDSGSWGGAGSDYMNLLQHFYGASRDSTTSSRLDITMAQNVIELNAWAPIQTTYGLGGMKIPGADTHLVVDTKWASGNNGAVVVSMNPTTGVPTWDLENIPTTATAPTDKLTVVLGGSGVNVVPNIRLFLFGICVTFDP